MSETTLTKSRRKSSADYEAMADQLLTDMKHLDALMQKDRREIEYFKTETARLEAENRTVLARLKAAW